MRKTAQAQRVLPPRVRDAINHASRETGISVAEILGPYQGHDVVDARDRAVRYLRGIGLSLPQIGGYLNRHHTTILHSLRKGGPPDNTVTVPDVSGEWAI